MTTCEKRRLERELTKAVLSRMFHVHEETISYWDRGVTPQAKHYKRVVDFLGYQLFIDRWASAGEGLIYFRLSLGMSQEDFGAFVGIDTSNIHGWETRRHLPTKYLEKKVRKSIECYKQQAITE